jgi:hypothetical protein
MKQQIDNLIANTLLDEGEVYLPGKGSLILRRHAAVRLSSKKLQAPYRELIFTPEERGVNLIALISRVANVSEERASDIFTEWLSKSSRVQSPTRRSLIIGGVCTIATYETEYRSTKDSYRGETSTITIDQTFENMANPKGRKVKKVNPRPKLFIYIMVGLFLGVALGVGGTYYYVNGGFDELLQKQSIIPTSDALKATNTEIEPIKAEAAVVEEPKAETNTEESVAEVVAPVEQSAEVVEQPTEQKNEQSVEPKTEQPAKEAAEQGSEQEAKLELLPMKRGQSYIVWGVYNERKNAEKAIAWLAEKHPEIECKLYRYGKQHLLSIYDQPSRAKCNSQLAQWKKKHPSFRNVWVHTQY